MYTINPFSFIEIGGNSLNNNQPIPINTIVLQINRKKTNLEISPFEKEYISLISTIIGKTNSERAKIKIALGNIPGCLLILFRFIMNP